MLLPNSSLAAACAYSWWDPLFNSLWRVMSCSNRICHCHCSGGCVSSKQLGSCNIIVYFMTPSPKTPVSLAKNCHNIPMILTVQILYNMFNSQHQRVPSPAASEISEHTTLASRIPLSCWMIAWLRNTRSEGSATRRSRIDWIYVSIWCGNMYIYIYIQFCGGYMYVNIRFLWGL